MSDPVGQSRNLGKRKAGDSDHVRQLGHDGDRISGQSTQPQQSGWMAHWTQSSVQSVTQSVNHSMPDSMSKESERYHLRSQLEMVNNSSDSCKGGRDVTRDEEVKIMSGSLSIDSNNVSQDRVDCQHLALRDVGPKKDCTFANPKSGTPTQGDGSLPENASHYSDSHLNPEKNIPAVSKKIEDHLMGSTSRTLPYGIREETSATESFASIQEGTSWPSFPFALEKHSANTNHHSNFSVLHHQNRSPSTSKTQLLLPAAKKWKELQGDCEVGSVPTQVGPPEPRTSDTFYLRYSALSKIPYSLCDVESVQMYTNIGSIEKVSGGPSKIPQTTHNIFISKTTDVKMSGQGRIFREPMCLMKIKEGCLKKTPYISPDNGYNDQTGVKLQPKWKTIDMDSSEDARHVKSSAIGKKNGSSSETNTMDVDNFKNIFCGVVSPQSNEEIKDQKYSSSQPKMTLSGKRSDSKHSKAGLLDLNQEPKTTLLDINEELLVPFDVASPVNCIAKSTSRTQSLDAEHFITHVEHPINSKSTNCPDSILSQEPGSRWVKRLKLSSSDAHAHCTIKAGEALPSERVDKVLSKITRYSMTSPELDISTVYEKEQRLLDPTISLLKKRKSCFSLLEKDRDMLLSHPWFRRWCSRQPAPSQKKSEMVVTCAPHVSNTAVNDVQNKQFPSIAAMALTGKAMNGFQPCEFQKRGSCLIWNVDGFLDINA